MMKNSGARSNNCEKLYEHYKKSLKVQPHKFLRREKKVEVNSEKQSEENFCITIFLKSGQNAPEKLDKHFLKAVQDEYATKYLEHMNIEPNLTNKNKLLE